MRWQVEVRVQSPTEMEDEERTHLLRRPPSARAHKTDTHGNEGRTRKEVAVEDLYPTPLSRQTWTARDFGAIWLSLSVTVTTYMFGSSLLAVGLNWWHATLAVFLGNVIVLVPLLLNGYAGTKYGIAFPVFLRSSFGRRGAVAAALSRGIVAIGWFAFNVWLGAQAIYSILLSLMPFLASVDISLGEWMGVSLLQLLSFVGFLAVHMVFVYKGIESMKVFEVLTSPLLGVSALALFAWAWTATGSLSAMLDATNQFESTLDSNGSEESTIAWLFRAFLPGLTAMVGAWSTMALNILDFTRFAKSQRAQVIGQSLGLPIPTTLFAFVGIAVTGATALLYGRPMWQPSELFEHFPTVWRIVANLVLVFSVLAMNITANLVSPANDFSNINPDVIDFKMGGYATGLAGLLIFPWKLFSDANDFIFIWLIGYSAVLGAVAGVMLCDFNILKRRELIVEELYYDPAKGGDEDLSAIVVRDEANAEGPDQLQDESHDGDSSFTTPAPKAYRRYDAITGDPFAAKNEHQGNEVEGEGEGEVQREAVVPGVGIYEYWRGWNVKAGVAVSLGLLPCLPGFLVAVRLVPEPSDSTSPLVHFVVALYHYAWFVAIAISFTSYYLLMKYSKWEGQARYEELLALYRQQHQDALSRRDSLTAIYNSKRKKSVGQSGEKEDGRPEAEEVAAMGADEEREDLRPEARRRRGGGKRSPSPQHAQPDQRRKADQQEEPHDEAAEDSGDYYTYTSSDPRDLIGGPDGYAESPTIEKYQHERKQEQRRRSRRLVAQWRQRQKERVEMKSGGGEAMTASGERRYVFFEEGEEPEKDEEEDKNARSHFVEYTEEEYEEMKQSLVREGMMSPPESESEGRWRAEKHLSI